MRKIFNRLRSVPALLVLLAAMVYSLVPTQDFVALDDDRMVYTNPLYNPLTPAHLLQFWQHPYEEVYRPLAYTYWAGVVELAHLPAPISVFGDGTTALDPHIFHAASLLLHLINTALVFSLLRLLVKHEWAAGGGALVFALHPVQVEAVAWISAMHELLCGTFSLLALRQYLIFTMCVTSSAQVQSRRRYYGWATLFFLLALFSKPTAAAVPLVAWILGHVFGSLSHRACGRTLALWLAVAALWIPITVSTQTGRVTDLSVPLWGRPLVAGDTLAFYLYKLLLPVNLSVDYGRSPQYVLGHAWGYLTWLLPLLLGALVWWCRQRLPWLIASFGIFVAFLLPVLGFLPFVYQHYSTVADRYLYLALLGPSLAVAHLLTWCRGRLILLTCAGVALLLASLSFMQTLVWYNSQTLLEQALSVNPNIGPEQLNYGLLLAHQGKAPEATLHLQQALRLGIDDPTTRSTLALLLTQQGRTEEAVSQMQEVIRLTPNDVNAYINLAGLLAIEGKYAEAVSRYQQALRIVPGNQVALERLSALQRQRQIKP